MTATPPDTPAAHSRLAWLRFKRASGAWGALRALLALALGMLLAVEAIVYAGLVNSHVHRPANNDLLSFYGSAQRVRDGASPYWPVPRKVPAGHPCHKHSQAQLDQLSTPPDQRDLALELACRPANLNPPFFSVLLQPLTALDVAQATRLWALLSVLSSVVAVGVVVAELAQGRIRGQGRSPRQLAEASVIALGGLYLWFPSWANFLFGQVTFLLMLPLALCWRAMRRGHDVQAGAYLGLLVGIKLFVGLFLLALVAARRWRMLAAALVCLLLTVLIGLYPAGLAAYRDYLSGLGQMDWTASNLNGSWPGYVSRFFGVFGASRNTPLWDAPALGRLLTWAGQIAVGGSLLVAVHRRGADNPDAVFALTLPAMLLISPLAWVYYDSWLALPAALIWLRHGSGPDKLTPRLLLMLCAAMMAAPRAFLGAWQVNDPVAALLDWGFYTYALVLCYVLAVYSYSVRSPSHPRRPPAERATQRTRHDHAHPAPL